MVYARWKSAISQYPALLDSTWKLIHLHSRFFVFILKVKEVNIKRWQNRPLNFIQLHLISEWEVLWVTILSTAVTSILCMWDTARSVLPQVLVPLRILRGCFHHAAVHISVFHAGLTCVLPALCTEFQLSFATLAFPFTSMELPVLSYVKKSLKKAQIEHT